MPGGPAPARRTARPPPRVGPRGRAPGDLAQPGAGLWGTLGPPIKKTHKETWSPMLYASSVLAMFWTVPGVLQSQSPLKIHVLGPSKLLLGLTETGHWLLKTRYRELVAAIGAFVANSAAAADAPAQAPALGTRWRPMLQGERALRAAARSWRATALRRRERDAAGRAPGRTGAGEAPPRGGGGYNP